MEKKKRRRRLSVSDVAYALRLSNGLVTETAKFLGVCSSTISKMIEDNSELRIVVNDSRVRLTDLAERRLYEKVDQGSEQSILFVMKTLGKERGYGDVKSPTNPTGEIKVKLPEDFPGA